MKKIYLLLILLFPIIVRADHIYNVDVDINILQDGNAQIEEVWDVQADSGSEWYKQLFNMENSEVFNYHVYMDNIPLTEKEWNIDESIEQKKGYYGIHNTSEGIELCFGKGDFNRHTFKLTYSISNYIFNTEDSQVLYWTILPKTTQDSFKATIHSYYNFPNDTEIYGFGYNGNVRVNDGKILMKSNEKLENNYVVLLARFPLNTFNTTNKKEKYKTFSDVLKRAKSNTKKGNIVSLVIFAFWAIVFTTSLGIVALNGYGYKNNKKIKKKEIPMFRDIPCNKDIYYANALLSMNTLSYGDTSIFGAIILKWVRSNKISFIKGEKNENNTLDLRYSPTFDNQMEKELFNMLYEASKDGILESRELQKWCSKNSAKFIKLFEKNKKEIIDILKQEGHVRKRANMKECRRKNVMDDTIYEESIKLFGLKKYLEEFSKMNTKEVIEVKLWDEYLMFAYLFGIAGKVAKQLYNLYPDLTNQGFDYDNITFINSLSSDGISSASSGGGDGSSGGGGSMGGR